MMISITMLCHYATCRILFIVMLSVIMLNIVILSVIMLNVVVPLMSAFNSIKLYYV
jgi:hypothetical protein